MQSEYTAITPQFICSYAWKQPPERPSIFQRAQKLLSRASENADASGTVHPSIPWKAYLALRELQHLASDIVEGFFSAPRGIMPHNAIRPAILMSKAPALPDGADKPLRGLLAPILPQEAAARREPELADIPDALPIAA
jgi:hypothetical protein